MEPEFGERAGWVLPVCFMSGASSLTSEVVLVRLLKLTLGNTVYASSVVVSVFLGGLALGSLLAGRRADRIQSPLRVYAALECGVAVTVVLAPFSLGLADAAYRVLYAAWHPEPASLLTVQVLVSALVLLPPTVLMGATLPVLAVKVVGPGADAGAGRSVGRLYAVNTLGAAVGCFVAGFVLIRELGVTLTLGFAAFLGLAAAFVAWRVAARDDVRSAREACKPRQQPAGQRPEPEPAPTGEATAAPLRTALLLAGFVAGFVGIAYEILWIRSIVNMVVATTYVFSSVLTVYLFGVMAGAWAASRMAGRPGLCLPALAGVLLALGGAGVAYVPWLEWGHVAATSLADLPALRFESITGISADVVRPLALSMGLFLLPSVVLGMGFPLVLGAWRSRAGAVGAATGALYGASTVGCVVGGLAMGWLLMPALGVLRAAMATGFAAVLMGAAIMFLLGGWWRLTAPAAVLVALAAGVATPGNRFTETLRARLTRKYRATGVLCIKEGATTVVSVHTQRGQPWMVPLSGTAYVQRIVSTPGDTRHLAVSGMHIASDEPGQRAWQKFHGHSAMLLHPAASRVVCVGYGSGESVACVSRHRPSVLECVEISPEVVEAADRFFSHINLGNERDRHVRMIFSDGKHYLRLTDSRYDVVASDPINPVFGENGSLYAREYFQSIRDRLDAGGLFLFWLPLHLPREVLESILATAMDVYPHVTLWTVPIAGGTFVQIVCSASEQRFSPAAIDRKMADERVKSDLAQVGIPSSAELMAYYRGDEADIAPCLTKPRINSDDRPVVEFSTRKAFFRETSLMILQLLGCGRKDGLLDHLDWQGIGAEEKGIWLQRLEAARLRVVP